MYQTSYSLVNQNQYLLVPECSDIFERAISIVLYLFSRVGALIFELNKVRIGLRNLD